LGRIAAGAVIATSDDGEKDRARNGSNASEYWAESPRFELNAHGLSRFSFHSEVLASAFAYE
jgi:hypothetical protein